MLVKVAKGHGLTVDNQIVWIFVHAEKLIFKQKRFLAGERNRPDVTA